MIAPIAFGQDIRSDEGKRPRVRILDTSNQESVGELVSADEKSVVWQSSGGATTRNASELLRVELASQQLDDAYPMVLRWSDGTTLFGKSLIGKEQSWTFSDVQGKPMEIGSGVVKSLQMRPLSGELLKAWESALTEPSESDALIVLRPGNTVDRVQGIIREIKPDAVVFDLEGQVVDVAYEKLAGVLWFRKPVDRAKPTVALRLVRGGAIQADSFSLKDGVVQALSAAGGKVQLSVDQLAVLDYGSANVRWLSEVEALDVKLEKRVDWKLENRLLERSLMPRMESSDGLGKDLRFPSPGSYSFRVPDGFQRFQSTLERRDRGAHRSELRVEVWQDDARVWEKAISIDEESLEVDIALQPGKRVRLVIASASELKVGTDVVWLRPRLMR